MEYISTVRTRVMVRFLVVELIHSGSNLLRHMRRLEWERHLNDNPTTINDHA